MLRAASSVFGRVIYNLSAGFPKHDTAFPTAVQCSVSLCPQPECQRNSYQAVTPSWSITMMFPGDTVFSLVSYLSTWASSNEPPLEVQKYRCKHPFFHPLNILSPNPTKSRFVLG